MLNDAWILPDITKSRTHQKSRYLENFHPNKQANIITYLLTPRIRVHLDKLIGFQLVKKLPAFYGTQRFITAFTSARHLSLSWASSIQSMPPHPTSHRFVLILFFHLRLVLPSGLFPSVSPSKICMHLFSPPYMLHAPLITFFSVWSPV